MNHDWNSLEDYLYQHQRRLEDYPLFIEDYSFTVDPVFHDKQSFVSIYMEILCAKGIKLTVVKTAEIRGRIKFEAKTVDYAYNASIMGKGNILRYDNAHIQAGHITKHHKHIFSRPGVEDTDSPFPIDEDKWPHLHEVIEELMDYQIDC